MIFGKGKKKRPSRNDDDEDEDEGHEDDDDLDFILFKGAQNGKNPDLGSYGKLVQAGLIPAKRVISEALARRAEMLRIEPKGKFAAVTFYVDGIPFPATKMPPKPANAIVQMLKLLAGLDPADRKSVQAGGINAEFEDVPHDVRIDIEPAEGGMEKLTLRAENISQRPETPRELGFSEDLQNSIRTIGTTKKGLMLAVGPPMSGVTTTSIAMLRGNDAYLLAVGTIGDMRGRDLPHVQVLDWNPGDNLATTIKRTKRSDIDILFVDPISSREIGKAILDACREQCLISEMPAKDAADGIARLNALIGDPELVASHLKLIVSPRLVRRLCHKCRQAYRPNPKLLAKVNLPPDTKVLYRAPRADDEDDDLCEACGGIGFRGRIGLIEAIEIDQQYKDLILKNASTADFRQLARKHSVQSFQKDGLRLVVEGKTSLEELQRAFRT